MNEEQQPAQPDKESTLPDTTKLEQLPDNMKSILNALVKAGFGSQKIKTEFEKKFPSYQNLIPAGRTTYQAYINAHYDELQSEVKAEQAITAALREDGQAVIDTADSVLGNTSGSVRQQLESLKQFVIRRIEFLEQYQAMGLPSAQLENTMASYASSLRAILEKTIEYGKELSREEDNQVDLVLESFMLECLTTVVEVYKKIHGDNKFQEFSIELSSNLKSIWEAVKRERIKDDGNKA